MTPNQYNACADIGEQMVTKDSDITRLLDWLARRGLIRRERPENNRRIVLTRITADGLRLLADLDSPIHESERKLMGHLGKQRLSALNELLEDCRLDT